MNHQKKNNSTDVTRELTALHLIKNLGAQRIRLLLQSVNHPQLIFRLKRHELESIPGIGPKTASDIAGFNDWDEVDRIIEKTHSIGAEIMTFWDDDYPVLLREIYDPPMMLWIKGDRKVLNSEGIAVVGTRRVGKYGQEMARKFSDGLCKKGLTVYSGLAYGVDGVAHKAAVESGGETVAVLGSGIDWIYPSDHKGLAAEIVNSGGAVISEFPMGTAPEMGNFPVRNRIVSGMSLGTLVIASGIKGGSMITARSALDQNREVFVIPHPIGRVSGEGCNSLIQNGMGKLVLNVEDILQEIDVHLSGEEPTEENTKKNGWRELELGELEMQICELLEESSYHIDTLAEKLERESYQLLPQLLELEMKNCVHQTAGKNFELK